MIRTGLLIAAVLGVGLATPACGSDASEESPGSKEQFGGGVGNVCADLTGEELRECETNVPRARCQIVKATMLNEQLRGISIGADRLFDDIAKKVPFEVSGSPKAAKVLVWGVKPKSTRYSIYRIEQNFTGDAIGASFYAPLISTRGANDPVPAIDQVVMHLTKRAGSAAASLTITATMYTAKGSWKRTDVPFGKLDLTCAYVK